MSQKARSVEAEEPSALPQDLKAKKKRSFKLTKITSGIKEIGIGSKTLGMGKHMLRPFIGHDIKQATKALVARIKSKEEKEVKEQPLEKEKKVKKSKSKSKSKGKEKEKNKERELRPSGQ